MWLFQFILWLFCSLKLDKITPVLNVFVAIDGVLGGILNSHFLSLISFLHLREIIWPKKIVRCFAVTKWHLLSMNLIKITMLDTT